jgi:hypothetical protein
MSFLNTKLCLKKISEVVQERSKSWASLIRGTVPWRHGQSWLLVLATVATHVCSLFWRVAISLLLTLLLGLSCVSSCSVWWRRSFGLKVSQIRDPEQLLTFASHLSAIGLSVLNSKANAYLLFHMA